MNALDRLSEGRARFARVLKALLNRNRLTHATLKELHDWAEPQQRTWLSTSQMSGIRTSRLKAPGPRAFDSMGQINLRLAQLAGVDAPQTRRLDPLPSVLPASLAHLRGEAWFAPRPDSGLPMTAGDLFEVWIGRLDPEIEESGYSDRQARAICERVGLLAQAWLADRSLLPTQGRPEIEARYPVDSKIRRERLWTALMGGTALKGEQLLEEEEALRELVGKLSPRGEALSPEEWSRWAQTGTIRADATQERTARA